MRTEQITRRVLGAVRFVDGNTGSQIGRTIAVKAQGVKFIRNRSNLYVVADAPGLREHRRVFEYPPASPALGSVSIELKVYDPLDRYLPRSCVLALPRDPDPENVDDLEISLFQPRDVELFSTPSAVEVPGWSVIRAAVHAEGSGERLPGAMFRVRRDVDGELIARGLSDWRGYALGEAMIGVPGIPVTTWSNGSDDDDGDGNGPVVVTEIPATLEVVYDPDFKPMNGDLPDPEDIEARWDDLPSTSLSVQLASGRTEKATLEVDLS